MIDAATIAAANTRIPLPELIGRDVALKRTGKELIGLCPFHGEKTPSFYVLGDHYHCFGCGAHGNAISYLMRTRSLDFPTAVRELANLPATAQPRAPDPPERGKRALAPVTEKVHRAQVDAIMRQAQPITERTAAWLYLWSRSLTPHQPGLFSHPGLYCAETETKYPALIAPITNSAGEVTAVQRIFVTSRFVAGEAPDSRAPLQVRKRTLGEMQNGSVRLGGAVTRRLGLAEGSESAIAASMLYRMPVWSVCGAARLATVWIPPEVEELWICGDNGDTGHALAEKAADAQTTRTRRCGVIYPDARYGDWNDQLRETAP